MFMASWRGLKIRVNKLPITREDLCPPQRIPSIFFHLQEIFSKVTKLSLQTIEKLNLSTSIFLTKFSQCRLGLTGAAVKLLGCSGRFGRAGRHQLVLEGTSEQLRAPWESESSFPPCHGKWLFLSFAELPLLLLLQPHPHPLQLPGQVPLLQLFIKRAIAIIANTFRSIWKPCSFWEYQWCNHNHSPCQRGGARMWDLGSEIYKRRRGFTPGPRGFTAATVCLVQGLAEVGTTQDLEAEDPSSPIASSVALDVTSPIKPSFPHLHAVL